MDAKFKHLERVGEKMKIKSEKAFSIPLYWRLKRKKAIENVLEIRKTQYKQQNPIENPHLEIVPLYFKNKQRNHIIQNPSPIEIFMRAGATTVEQERERELREN